MSSIYISESENEMPATDVQEWGENEVEEQELDSEMPVESESEGTYVYIHLRSYARSAVRLVPSQKLLKMTTHLS